MIKIFNVEDNIKNIYSRLEDDGIIIIADDRENRIKKVKELKRYLDDKNDEDFWNDDFEERIEISNSAIAHKNCEVGFVFDISKYRPTQAQELAKKAYEEEYGDEWEESN